MGIRDLHQYEENCDSLTWDIWCPGNDLNQNLPNTSLKHYSYFSVVIMTMKIVIVIWVMASFGVVAQYQYPPTLETELVCLRQCTVPHDYILSTCQTTV